MSTDALDMPRNEAERGLLETLARQWRRLRAVLDRWRERLQADSSAGALLAGTVAVALGLGLVQALLFAPGGQGIEDFLGWSGRAGRQAAVELLDWWDANGLRPFAWLYLLADTLLFVPVYSACFLALALRLANALCDDDPERLSPHERWVLVALAAPVLALVAVDLLENTVGLARTGPRAGLAGLLAALLCWRVLRALGAWRQLRERTRPRGGAPVFRVAMPLALALLAAAGAAGNCGGGDVAGAWSWWGPLGCAAHGAKQWLVALVLVLLMASGAIWFFGVSLRSGTADTASPKIETPGAAPGGVPGAEPAGQPGVGPAKTLGGDPAASPLRQRRGEREQLRAAVGDVLLRSRYVLIALALMAGLTVVMDQGRDVVYAMAASPYRQQLAQPIDRWWLALGALAAFGVTAAALWLFVFSCWLWTRSVCQIRTARSSGAASAPPSPMVERFTQQWARCLAGVPAVLMVLLCAGVMRDSVSAAVAGTLHWRWPVLTLGGFGLLTLVLGGAFLRLRSRAGEARYYNAIGWADWVRRVGIRPEHRDEVLAKYRLARRIDPRQLPLLLALGLLLARAADVLPDGLPWQGDLVPTMVLPVILFSLALWLCFFGWLSLLEVQFAVPWVLLLVLLIGGLGLAGLTVNHGVWPALGPAPAPDGLAAWLAPTGLVQMFHFSALLLGLLVLAYLWALRWATPRTRRLLPPAHGRRDWLGLALGVALAAALAGLLWLADHLASPRQPAPPAQVLPASQRPGVDAALADWLGGLCGPATGLAAAAGMASAAAAAGPASAAAAPACQPRLAAGARGPGGELPVYFVSTEGGGIRAAVWTAFMLQRLAAAQPDFLARTFSISGVSGGAVGAAVFRACGDEPAARQACLQRLAGTDLLAPLLAAWMLEDATARVLPTAGCRTPGCGFLSRGAWFEQALETGAGGLRSGLIASRGALPGHHGGRPYLLLNSTWVESGERAINSDLQIDWRLFGGARDTLGLTGRDMPLASAAHNAARFPYINAIGALRTAPGACQDRRPADVAVAASSASSARSSPGADADPVVCGHLADGGYFDNSGAQTTLDLLHALERCLLVQPGDADAALYPRCRALPAAQRDWLRAHLVPQVLMIRNSADPATALATGCDAPASGHRPGSGTLVPEAPADCLALNASGYRPERPQCRGRANLYVDLLGPAIALLNVSGIGANGLLAEAHQAAAVQLLHQRLGGLAAASAAAHAARAASAAAAGGSTGQQPAPGQPPAPTPWPDGAPVVAIDLLRDGVRYPLGWHLSAAAVEGMARQAGRCLR